MGRITSQRALAVVTAAAVLAGVTAVTMSAPASAAKPKCQGKVATIVGTKKADILKGTAKRDIIVAKAGNDRIYAKGGNDLICAGNGDDRVFGGVGADTIWGQAGNDILNGNSGNDFLAGQVGNDTLNGGTNYDTCYQGTGPGAVTNCEVPAPPAAPAPAPPPPSRPSLLPLSGLLAVAYSDIDGLDGYSSGDVLIALLRDASGDGQPGPGDRVEMGRYPTNHEATSFADWTVKTHDVGFLNLKESGCIGVDGFGTGGTGPFTWCTDYGSSDSIQDLYREGYYYSDGSSLWDRPDAGSDEILIRPSSPSQPSGTLSLTASGYGDDGFIDVWLYEVPQPLPV